MMTRRDLLMGTAAFVAAGTSPLPPIARLVDPTIYKLGGGPLVAGDLGIGQTVLAVFDGVRWTALLDTSRP